jgi:spore coat polysaccharide biosynthesis protein SpsF
MRFGNKKTLLEFIIDRSLAFGLNPIVCTSHDESDDVINEISKDCGVPCFRGSLDNKIKRWYDCASKYNMTEFHTIDADDPFFDGYRMTESLQILRHQRLDYLKPSVYSDSGGATEGYSINTQFLERIALENQDEDKDTEMAVFYFDKDQTAISGVMKNPEYCIQIEKQFPRLTLDYYEDYIMLNSIFYILNSPVKRNEIEEYLSKNKDIVNINMHLNASWKKRQLSKKV